MTLLARVNLRWTGFTGGPGNSFFYMRDFVSSDTEPPNHQAAVDRVDSFKLGISSYLPSVVSLSVDPEVQIIDEFTGDLVDVETAVPAAAENGNQPVGQAYSAATGGVITWRTALVRNNRRIRGRTFIVPMSSGAFEADGTLLASTVAGLNIIAADMYNVGPAAVLGIWARPVPADPDDPGSVDIDGQWAPVTSHSVPDMSAVLRSRRD